MALRAGIVVMVVGVLGLVAGVQAQTVLLRDVRLIDGTGAPPQEHVSLLLQDGRIEKIGTTMAVPKGATAAGVGRMVKR